MKKYLLIVLLIVFIAPSIAFASWWNPFTWFQKKAVQPPVVQVSIPIPVSSNKQIGKEKVVQKKEKKDIQPTSKQTAPTTPSTSGGGGAMGFSGVQPIVPLKCSDYKNYFTSIASCEFIKKSSSANQDGVEIDPPLYTLCMKCNGTTSTVPTPAPALDYSKYTNPITGKIYTPQEYADVVTNSKKDITPYINLKVNDQDGPITVNVNSLVNVSWTSANVVSCSGSTNNNKPLNGRETIYIDSDTTSPFTLKCLTSSGVVVSDSVVLNITGKTLKNTDPYGVLYGTGNAYTPEQLNAIDCAYYGRNCPTIHVIIDN